MPDDSKTPASAETAKAPVPDEATTLMSLFTPEALAEDTEKATEAASDSPADEEPVADEEEHPEEEEVESSEESDETEEAPPVEATQPRKLRIPKEDGTHEEVDEDEAVKGYMRREDYTRKRMADAEREKEREAEFAKVREERQRYATALAELETALKPAQPDWEKIQKEAPEQFPALFAQYQIEERNYLTAQQERQKADLQVMKDRAEQRAKLQLEEKAKLLEKMPDLSKPEVRETLGTYLKAQGFTDEEIAGTDRHELFVMARKAQLYDEAMKQKPKVQQKVESKIRPAKPGASASVRPAKSQIERDVKRLEKTGSIQDAAKVFEHFV